MERAETAYVDRVTEHGAGTQSYVRMPDGYLVECGTGHDGLKRSELIRDAVNKSTDQ